LFVVTPVRVGGFCRVELKPAGPLHDQVVIVPPPLVENNVISPPAHTGPSFVGAASGNGNIVNVAFEVLVHPAPFVTTAVNTEDAVIPEAVVGFELAFDTLPGPVIVQVLNVAPAGTAAVSALDPPEHKVAGLDVTLKAAGAVTVVTVTGTLIEPQVPSYASA
jgi:hypothetical protein